jgi:hypothetical protein
MTDFGSKLEESQIEHMLRFAFETGPRRRNLPSLERLRRQIKKPGMLAGNHLPGFR